MTVERQVVRPVDVPREIPVDPPGDPALAIRNWFAALADGRTSEVIDAIPSTKRDDVDRWFIGWLQSVDPSERAEAAKAVANFASTLEEKHSFLLGSDRVTLSGPLGEALREQFDDVLRVVAAVANWPGWEEPVLKDSRDLVAVLVKAIAAEPELAERLRRLEVTARGRTDGGAVVYLTSQGGKEGHDVALSLVNSVWVPVRVIERWEELRKRTPGSSSGGTVSLGDFTQRLNEMTAALAKVSSQQEFDALADHAATVLLAKAAETQKGPRSVTSEELVTVQVLFETALTEAAKDEQLWQLASQTDEPVSGRADATDLADGKGMTVMVGPVADLQAYVRRLADAGWGIHDTDDKTRTITVWRLAP